MDTSKSVVAKYLRLCWANTSLDCGVAGLLACRTKAIWLAPKAARAGLCDESCLSACPFCDVNTRETMAHMFLHCSAWAVERAQLLARVIAKARKLRCGGVALSDRKVAVVLLGGKVEGRGLKGWGEGKSPLYISVARFLAAIKGRRSAVLFSKIATAAPT